MKQLFIRSFFPFSSSKLWMAGAVSCMGLIASCGKMEEGDTSSETLAVKGPFLSQASVRNLVVQAGFKGAEVDTAVRIAKCESSFGVGSFAIGQGRQHTGLFQISDLHRTTCGYGRLSIQNFRNTMTNPSANAKCARIVYLNAGSFRPWDCFTGRR